MTSVENTTAEQWHLEQQISAACKENNLSEVLVLLAQVADCNVPRIDGETPIMWAALEGHKEVVSLLLIRGADCNHQTTDGSTPLYVASKNGHAEVAKLLIASGADCNRQRPSGSTPLYIASQEGHAEVAKLLIASGADCNRQRPDGVTPIHIASKNGHAEVAKLLVASGADCNRQRFDGSTPLYMASYNGHAEVAKLLIASGADCNRQRPDGVTPIHIASKNGHAEVAKLLVASGADCNRQRFDGATPLYMASYNGHAEVAKLLIASGADCNCQMPDGVTPLHSASSNGHVEVVYLLLRRGADYNRQTTGGVTPLYIASQNGHVEVVHLLLKRSADCNRQTSSGATPLFIASKNGHMEVAKLLIASGADCNRKTSRGAAPLYIASENGHVEVAKLLIASGADCNHQMPDGSTPLYIASFNGHVDVAKLLIASGADCNHQKTNGETPLCIASYNGHVEMVRRLLHCGANPTLLMGTRDTASTLADQTVYPALTPMWEEMQETIANAHAQHLYMAHPPRVSFIGRFKTGKSRLINALVGTDVLPSDLDECTAHLVELAYGFQKKITRLIGHDLHTALEEIISPEQFLSAVNLTAPDKMHLADDAAFRYYLASPLLQSIRVIDTPGFDGTNSEMRTRGSQARERAIQQSHLCILVLSAGLGLDDVKSARLIHHHGAKMVVVLNQSDKYDSDDRMEMKQQILSDLEREVGVKPAFFTCSALWQSGSEQKRDEIEHQRRFLDHEDETQWHQWDALISHLSHSLNGERDLRLLDTLRRAFDLARRVNNEYDINRQAEATFLDNLPRWQEMMPSLVGQAILEMAVSAAKSKRPIPWKRLENFGITPEIVAPRSIVSDQEVNKLVDHYSSAVAALVSLAIETHCAKLYKYLVEDVSTCIKLIGNEFSVPAHQVHTLHQAVQKAEWYSQPLRSDFIYQNSLANLQARWKANPAELSKDCSYIQKRLSSALA